MIQVRRFQSSPLFQRLLRGVSATALGPVVSAVTQLGTVPVLLYAWGAPKYGDWLILWAIPSYLTLSNLGFGDASGSDMTVRVARDDRKGALETFQSSWALLLLVSLFASLFCAVAVWSVPWHRWMRLSTLSDWQASAVILVLGLYVLISQQCGILESGFRCDGNFATGTVFGSLLCLSETALATVVGVLSSSLLWMAITYLLTRTAGTVIYGLLLHRRSPWLYLGLQHARLQRVKQLAAPAFGFMAFPLANSIGIQGFILLIARLKGPAAVTEFSTLRTLTRVNFQLMAVIAWAVWPELSRAFGQGDIPLARRLHRGAYQASLALSLVTGTALWCFGPFVYRVWIHKAVVFDPTCFHILIFVTLANSLWFTSSAVPMSTNEHHRITVAFVGISALFLGLGWVLVQRMGLSGAAIALLLIDLSMIWIVLRTSLNQLQDKTGDFMRALILPSPLFSFGRTARATLYDL